MCRVDQLVEGRGLPVRVAGRYLAVFLVEGEPHVLDNQCLHTGAPLDGGFIDDGVLTCPWHGWTYDVRSGDLVTQLGKMPGLRRYNARVDGAGVVLVTLEN